MEPHYHLRRFSLLRIFVAVTLSPMAMLLPGSVRWPALALVVGMSLWLTNRELNVLFRVLFPTFWALLASLLFCTPFQLHTPWQIFLILATGSCGGLLLGCAWALNYVDGLRFSARLMNSKAQLRELKEPRFEWAGMVAFSLPFLLVILVITFAVLLPVIY